MNQLIKVILYVIFFLGVWLTIERCTGDYEQVPLREDLPSASWQSYTLFDEALELKLPVRPTYTEDALDSPQSTNPIIFSQYTSEGKQEINFLVHRLRYPANINLPEPKIILQSVVNEILLSKDQNRLKVMEYPEFRGMPSILSQVEHEKARVWTLGFMHQRDIYVITGLFFNLEYNHKAIFNQVLDSVVLNFKASESTLPVREPISL